MLIKNDFEVAQPVDKVWQFFDDIPQVAACLPGAELTEDLGDDKYNGQGRDPDGPGQAAVRRHRRRSRERDDAAKRIVVDAAGADEKGRGQAAMLVTAQLAPAGRRHQGRRRPGPAALRRRRAVRPRHDLRRHRRADARLRRPTCRTASTAIDAGRSPDQIGDRGAGRAASPSACAPLRMALSRVFRRFFLPYQPNPS